MTNFIFIGTVESIEPAFLSRWDQSTRSTLPLLNEAFAEAQNHPSEASLSKVKDAFLKVVPGLPASERKRLESAKTALEVVSLFNAQVFQGIRVRLRLRTLFKHEDDDDEPPAKAAGVKDPKARDDDDNDLDRKPAAPRAASVNPPKAKERQARKDSPGDIVEIWTAFGDCGVDFQSGETYLVYADEDEGTDQLFSDKCSRTRRLTDAGEDLAYLFFYNNRRKESSRVEGFATSDPKILLDRDDVPERVNLPRPGLVIELRSSGLSRSRYTKTDNTGRYFFDGLAEGDYEVSAFPSRLSPKPLSGPYPVQLKESTCANQLLFIFTEK